MVFQGNTTPYANLPLFGVSANKNGFQSSLSNNYLNQILLILTLIFNRRGH